MKRYIVLEGLFDFKTLSQNKTLSAAVTRWLKCFLQEINYVYVGHEYSRVWPLGGLFLKSKKTENGFILGYLNIYIFRKLYLLVSYFYRVSRLLKNSNFDDTIIIHSCQEYKNQANIQILIAKLFKKLKGINVICIVGDGLEPDGFDAYFFVTYHTFSISNQKHKFLFEGVVEDPKLKRISGRKRSAKKTQIMYSGAIDGHVSLKNLIVALQHKKFKEKYELLITGICDNKELKQFFNAHNNVKFLGFLSDEELFKKCLEIDVFINPRRIDFLPNEFNFPSKLLYYMQFDKPIISSITKGISPDFKEALIPINGDAIESYLNTLTVFDDFSNDEIDLKLKKQIQIKKKLSKDVIPDLISIK